MAGFQTWYDTNKKDFNAKRRKKYAKNKAYRERVNSYTRRTRSDDVRKILEDGTVVVKRDNGKFVPCYRMGVTAKRLGIAPHIIRTMEKQGLIPLVGSSIKRHMRYYTDKQIGLMKELLGVLKQRRLGQISIKIEKSLILKIQREWDK